MGIWAYGHMGPQAYMPIRLYRHMGIWAQALYSPSQLAQLMGWASWDGPIPRMSYGEIAQPAHEPAGPILV